VAGAPKNRAATREETSAMSTHVYMIWSNPIEGREAEFNAYHEGGHIRDVLRVPGIIGCRRLRLDPGGPSRGGVSRYSALFEFDTADAPGAIAEMRARRGTPLMPAADPPVTGDVDRASLLYEIISETPAAADWARAKTPLASKYVYMVMTAPKPGEDEAFNAFYDGTHVPEVLTTPDVVGCRRLRLAPGFDSTPRPQSYVALYEFASEDGLKSLAELTRRSQAGAFQQNPHIDSAKSAVGFYKVLYEALA
jgi:hypothetical protein